MTKHRKIGDFEYDYKETEIEYEDGPSFVKKKTFEIIFKKIPSDGLTDFIHALEQSGILDKEPEKIYVDKPNYGRGPLTYDCNDNITLCTNEQHDAKTRTLTGESSNARTRLSSKNLSTQAYRYKENRREEKERA